MVVSEGEYRIAQYGQWDHYPSGQGVDILKFCQEHMTNAEDMQRFRNNLKDIQWVDESNVERIRKAQEEDRYEAFPYLTRDHGSDILLYVFAYPDQRPSLCKKTFGSPDWGLAPGKAELILKNSLDFIKDSLFCEWAYVLDLDKMQLEVYKGFNTFPVPPGQRFSEMEPEKPDHCDTQYYPCVEERIWKFDALPTKEDFLKILEPNEGEE
jgi:hypothetical protein